MAILYYFSVLKTRLKGKDILKTLTCSLFCDKKNLEFWKTGTMITNNWYIVITGNQYSGSKQQEL